MQASSGRSRDADPTPGPFATRRRSPVRGSPAGKSSGAEIVERWLAFSIPAALLLFVALNEGGYALTFRQQLGVVLWWGVGLALAFRLLPRSRLSPEARVAGLSLGAFALLAGLSAIWGESAERASAELARVLVYLGALVAILLSVSAKTWKPAAAGICAALFAVPFLGVASRLFPDAFDIGLLAESDRLAYPLGYWNALAGWCAMAIVAGLSLSAHLRRRGIAAVCLGSVPVAGVALYLTYSRGGLAVAVLGLVFAFLVARQKATLAIHAAAALAGTGLLIAIVRGFPEISDGTGSVGGIEVAAATLIVSAAVASLVAVKRLRNVGRSRAPRLTAAPLAAAAGAGVALMLAMGPELAAKVEDEFTSGAYPAQTDDPATRLTSLEGARDEVWGSALAAFSSDPLTGVGAGAFEFWWERDVPGGEQLRDAHSLYLETLAELGIPGLLLLGGFIGAVLVAGIRRHRDMRGRDETALSAAMIAVFAVFALHAAIDWLWESTALALVAVGAAACLVASGSAPRRARRWPFRGVAAAVTAAVLAGALLVPGVVATERIQASSSALGIGQAEEAERISSDAIEAQPWAASPYAARAYARAGAGGFTDARADASAAIEREPTNWRHYALLGGVEAALGDRDAAREAFLEARRLGGEFSDEAIDAAAAGNRLPDASAAGEAPGGPPPPGP